MTIVDHVIHRGAVALALTVMILGGAAACDASPDEQAVPSGPTASPTASPSTTPSASPSPAGSQTETPTETPTDTPTGTPTNTPTEVLEPEYVQYAGGESPGVTVHRAEQARLLHDAPADFRDFVGRYADRLAARAECDAPTGVTVASVRTDGYADGSVSSCGGYRALWARVDGAWQEVVQTQELWPCRPLRSYGFPDQVVGTRCFDYDAGRAHGYHHA